MTASRGIGRGKVAPVTCGAVNYHLDIGPCVLNKGPGEHTMLANTSGRLRLPLPVHQDAEGRRWTTNGLLDDPRPLALRPGRCGALGCILVPGLDGHTLTQASQDGGRTTVPVWVHSDAEGRSWTKFGPHNTVEARS